MKRTTLAARITLLAEKRAALLAASRQVQRSDLTDHWRAQAEKDLELAAVAYAVVLIRYVGGDRA